MNQLLGLAVALLALVPTTLAAAATAAAVTDPYDRSNVPIEERPANPAAAKIVLIAGDAGVHPPGDHEHFAGCALFYRLLKQNPGVAPVMVQDGWPKNPEETFKNARAVVFYMDGVGKQTTIAHAAEVDKLAAAGVGIVHVHQAIDYPADFVPHAIQWLGGSYPPKGGLRGHWDATYDTFGDHPATRGVTPFHLINEGFIYKLDWVAGMKGVTPILRCKNPKEKPGVTVSENDQVVVWAYERPDGGRSFVNTGGHAHANWGQEGFRRLMINGILWAAKVEVPPGGAKVDLDPADLMQNMEKKPKKAPTTKKAKPAAKAK